MSTRRSALAAAVALSATLHAACAANPAPSYPGMASLQSEPLRVWVAAPTRLSDPWAVFHVNRPAYVAIFDVRPHVGVTAVYPGTDLPEAQRPRPAGLQAVLRRTGPPTARLAYGPGVEYGFLVDCLLGESHFPVVWRLIVASERPLQLTELRHEVAFQFQPAVQSRTFASAPSFRIMDAILDAVLPAGAGLEPEEGPVEWAADYAAFWFAPRCAGTGLPLALGTPFGRWKDPAVPRHYPPPVETPLADDGGDDAANDGGDASDGTLEEGFAPPPVEGNPRLPIRLADEGARPEDGGAAGTLPLRGPEERAGDDARRGAERAPIPEVGRFRPSAHAEPRPAAVRPIGDAEGGTDRGERAFRYFYFERALPDRGVEHRQRAIQNPQRVPAGAPFRWNDRWPPRAGAGFPASSHLRRLPQGQLQRPAQARQPAQLQRDRLPVVRPASRPAHQVRPATAARQRAEPRSGSTESGKKKDAT